MIASLDISNWITSDDLYWFREGTHFRLYRKFGAHAGTYNGEAGVYFTLWAPNAEPISVIGSFNDWDAAANPMHAIGDTGIWSAFVPGVPAGSLYKYQIQSRIDGSRFDKADPFGWYHETPPRTASIVWDLSYHWNDSHWMATRAQRTLPDKPLSIYQVHLGSWMRVPEEGNRPLTYLEIAPKLAAYARHMNFTHVQFLPVMEHPAFESLGYQPSGLFAPSSRYGTPQDFMRLIDILHQNFVGVILDWGLCCIPADAHGLANFDGTHLFERDDLPIHRPPGGGRAHPFNCRSMEVRSFLLSGAFHWLDHYHIDGLRVGDGFSEAIEPDVATMEFLHDLADTVAVHSPGVPIIGNRPFADQRFRPPARNCSFSWDKRRVNDVLAYLGHDPADRRHHHDLIVPIDKAFTRENLVLPLARDQMMEQSLLARMPGDEWQKFANLRLLLAWMCAQPAKKLLFMGLDFAQWDAWNFLKSLDWHLVASDGFHTRFQRWVSELNQFYLQEPALHQTDSNPHGFEWVETHEAELSTASWIRRGATSSEMILAAFNFTPSPRQNHRLGVPSAGFWTEVLNSDARDYGGSGQGNLGGVEAAPFGWHHKSHSLVITLPPLGAVFFKRSTQPPLA